jgi:hypothetical protein
VHLVSRGKSLKRMVHPAGLEPAAFLFEVKRSIQLSYGCTLVNGKWEMVNRKDGKSFFIFHLPFFIGH